MQFFVFIGENVKLVMVRFWNYAPEPNRDKVYFLIKQTKKCNNSTRTQDIVVDIMISRTCRTVPEKLPPTPSQKMSTCDGDHDQCWRYCRRLWCGLRWWGLMKNRLRRCLVDIVYLWCGSSWWWLVRWVWWGWWSGPKTTAFSYKWGLTTSTGRSPEAILMCIHDVGSQEEIGQ